MTSALLDIARTGRTSNDYLVRIFRSQKINQVLGGAVVMPWEVDQVNEEWMDAFSALIDELPKVQEMVKSQDRNREAWLKKQDYRGYLKKR